MKKIVLGFAAAAAALGFTHVAMAADLATPYLKAPPPPPCLWCGFYFGGNIGYSWGRERDTFSLLGFSDTFNQPANGVIGGGQWGYSWQRGTWVFGAEGDFQGSGERDTTIFGLAPLPAIFTLTDTQSLTWFGTDRGRLGFLVTPNIMFYGTAGVAYGHVDSTYTLGVIGIPLLSVVTNENRVGWTAGAGIEGKFAQNWSAKIEYLHLDLGTETATATVVGVPLAATNQRFTDDLVRVGVNYWFSF
jgi:outer membrane immunogenic protein